MPKRKKLPGEYTGVPNDENKLIVQKSTPLQTLCKTDLTLTEFKILDAYLSRIDSHNPTKRTVRFERGELEKILGVTRILRADLDQRLRHLFQVVDIVDPEKPNGINLIGLFDTAKAVQDEDGLWIIDLRCSEPALEYVFNVESLGYLRYKLKCVINLTSRYSYVLFLYILDNRFRKKWQIDIKSLKDLLKCNAETYEQYFRFNGFVLKKAQQEIFEKTDVRYDYHPIKRGRSIVGVEFEYHSEDPEQITMFDALETEDYEENDDIAKICEYSFSNDEVKLLAAVAERLCVDKSAIRECYNRMKVYEKNAKIKNRLMYLVRVIEKDAKGKNPGIAQSFDVDEFFEAATKRAYGGKYDNP